MPDCYYSRRFRKMYRKLPIKVRKKFKERRDLFLSDLTHSLLNNHPLGGEYVGCFSINVTGDYRAIYYWMQDGVMQFIAIGTHSDLYE